VLAAVLDVLAPTRCAACGAFAEALCLDCRRALASARLVVRHDIAEVERVVALGTFHGVLRRVVLALKYANRLDVADEIARALASKADPDAKMLVPVPLHAARSRWRGYNQADTLARALTRAWCAAGRGALQVMPAALCRSTPTSPQSGLRLRAREENVGGAFAPGVQAKALSGQQVVLVDDVVTTGATIRACARVLRACGATRVAVICAATRP